LRKTLTYIASDAMASTIARISIRFRVFTIGFTPRSCGSAAPVVQRRARRQTASPRRERNRWPAIGIAKENPLHSVFRMLASDRSIQGREKLRRALPGAATDENRLVREGRRAGIVGENTKDG
jgi:hypothetical protein